MRKEMPLKQSRETQFMGLSGLMYYTDLNTKCYMKVILQSYRNKKKWIKPALIMSKLQISSAHPDTERSVLL